MNKQQLDSFEWMGRVMGPDPFIHDVVVGGAKRREQEARQQAIIDEAWTVEADAWNMLANITNLEGLNSITIPASILTPMVWSMREQPISADEPVTNFYFRRIRSHGSLCEQWAL